MSYYMKVLFGVAIVACLLLSGVALTPGVDNPTADHTTLGPHAVRGVNYAHIHRGGRGYGSEASRKELTHLGELGIDWIALNPFGYQNAADQDHVSGYDPDRPLSDFTAPLQLDDLSDTGPGRDRSMTDLHIARQIEHAHELGIKVMIKPHIWSRDFWNGDAWHGTVQQNTPEAHESWRKSYLRFILHHARLAQQTRAEALCIGTELISQTQNHHDDWLTVIREVRKVYDGQLTYAAHWDTEFSHIRFWDQLDVIGISAYFPLDVEDDATVDQLVRAWQPHKARVHAAHTQYQKPVVFLEAGYRPATGAYRAPWLDKGGDHDPMIQARAYEALFRTFRDEPWWHGVFFWKAFTDTTRGDRPNRPPDFSFRNQPAEEVIRQWFKRPRVDTRDPLGPTPDPKLD